MYDEGPATTPAQQNQAYNRRRRKQKMAKARGLACSFQATTRYCDYFEHESELCTIALKVADIVETPGAPQNTKI
jgi:hypothetical protein